MRSEQPSALRRRGAVLCALAAALLFCAWAGGCKKLPKLDESKLDTDSGNGGDNDIDTDGDGDTDSDSDSDTDVALNINWIGLEGGQFMMGSPDGAGLVSEYPSHQVTLRSFDMMEAEVSVSQYAKCFDAEVCTVPSLGESCAEDFINWGVTGRENHPVNCVNWNQAVQFCKWAGARLPSEAEWEFAATGGLDWNDYPWGKSAPTCNLAIMDEGGAGCGENSTWPVCSVTAGNTLEGLCDMAGNAYEWTQDWWHDNYEGAPVNGSAWEDPPGVERVVRGGSFVDTDGNLRGRMRFTGGDPNVGIDTLGFRCARGSNPGASCSSADDCHVDAVCPKLFTGETGSYCYLGCEDGQQVCDGTAYPFCTSTYGAQLCLDSVTISGTFDCQVDVFGTSNVTLNVGSNGSTMEVTVLDACYVYRTKDGGWGIQFSFVSDMQRDAVFWWRNDQYLTNTPITDAPGMVYDNLYDETTVIVEQHIRGFFQAGSGTIVFTQAGVNTGDTVSGTITFNGYAYNADMAVN